MTEPSDMPSIRVPPLVLHRTDERCLRVEEGRYRADRIPGARFVELPGQDHLPFVGDQDSILNQVFVCFVAELGEIPEHKRVLATLLYVRGDIDKSDPRAADLDDEAKKEISWFHGEKVGTVGSGLLATFDGPARAIRCALTIMEAARASGLDIASTLHTGECELLDGGVGGTAVRIGEGIAGAGVSGTIIVSDTVTDLVAGSGLLFDPHSTVDLGESLGHWPLFSVRRDQ